MAINLKTTLLAFLLPAIAITLFPPFNWGEERLQTEVERRETVKWGSESRGVKEVLPLKQRAFLFGDTKREFKTRSSNSDFEAEIPLNRKLIVGDVILEYLLAMFFAVLIGLLQPKLSGFSAKK